jgi:subtilisin family serine protease
LPTPGVPGLLSVPETVNRATAAVLAPETLQTVRARAVAELLRTHSRELEADPAGEPVRRGELLLMAPSAALLDTARAAGFRVVAERDLEGLGSVMVTLRVPPGLSTATALELLRAWDPEQAVDFHHLYTGSGAVAKAAPPAGNEGAELRPERWRIGLIDGGVERHHPALRGVKLQTHGCAGAQHTSVHGTAVASLLVGRARRFEGAAPGGALYAADVYCGDGPGGGVVAVAEALSWLARERVPVVNVSLVGPPNRVLNAVVEAFLSRGHLLVAAVGNDGPAAPPLFPAAYPGVIGVTGVDRSHKVLPEAARGPHVMFAAPGADLAVAAPGGSYAPARGTSFAAPLVAGLLARRLAEPAPEGAAAAAAALVRQAVDLGAPGWDLVYGHGLVGDSVLAAQR